MRGECDASADAASATGSIEDEAPDAASALAELELLDSAMRTTFRKRVVGWVIRWGIVAVVLLVVIRRKPEWWYLGPLGVALGLLSLGTLLWIYRRFRRRLGERIVSLRAQLEELDRLDAEADGVAGDEQGE
jgi:hypothetical protein